MKDKTKKGLVVGVSLALSLALIVMIGSELRKESSDDVVVAPNSSQSTDVNVDDLDIKENDITLNPIESSNTDDMESNNGGNVGTEQSIQPEPVQPEYTQEELTDPTKKPDGQKVESTETPKEPANNGGLPGFENVPDMGENHHEHLDDMYENGNKIGIMN